LLHRPYQEKDFIPRSTPELYLDNWNGETYAPSNIALIKYWGKSGLQIPMNASLSFLLPQSITRTRAKATLLKQPAGRVLFNFRFQGAENPDFNRKIAAFFDRISVFMPFLPYYKWEFESTNNFPHSAGIASSASGFGALAKLLIDFEKALYPHAGPDYLYRKTSFIARLGSGSAARSVTGPVSVWGSHPDIPGSNDLYAIDFPFEIHQNFGQVTDLILLLEKEKKEVSSTQGHALIDTHPFKKSRIEQARQHLSGLSASLQTGDWEQFGKITETEALTLHAMMMTSDPYYILMQPSTLRWIKQIWDLRKSTGIPVYFTLDAGANLHIIYPTSYEKRIFDNLEEISQTDKLLNRIEIIPRNSD